MVARAGVHTYRVCSAGAPLSTMPPSHSPHRSVDAPDIGTVAMDPTFGARQAPEPEQALLPPPSSLLLSLLVFVLIALLFSSDLHGAMATSEQRMGRRQRGCPLDDASLSLSSPLVSSG